MNSVNLARAAGLAVGLLALAVSGCSVEGVNDAQLEELESVTTGPLMSPAQTLLWSGTVEPGDPTPAQCGGNPCDSFPLTVALPEDIWVGHDGAVQVAVRWPFVFDSLSLYVYQGSTLVASAEGMISEGEVLMMPSLANGEYTIYVAWNPVSTVTQACRELFGNIAPGASVPESWAMQNPVVYSLMWIVAIVVVFAPLSVRQYRRSSAK